MSTAALASPSFHAAARDAVVEYARTQARLPAFAPKQAFLPFTPTVPQPEELVVETTVARLVACGRVDGQVLPRTDDVWLVVLLFNDFTSATIDELKRLMLLRRVRWIKLLTRLASCSSFPLDSTIDCAKVSTERPAQSFWLELLQALDPEAANDTMKNLERNLVVLSRGSKLRILVRIETDPSQGGFTQSLSHFFDALEELDPDEADTAFFSSLKTCALTELTGFQPVELGLQFTHGKMTKAVMTSLLDRIVKLPKPSHFQVTCLRFGLECALQTTAVEVLGERLEELDLATLELGSTRGVRPSSLRRCLGSVPSSAHRLITTDHNASIGAFASMARYGDPSTNKLRQLDMICTPSLDLAAWLAYGLFHVDSSSPITSLCMRMPPDSRWLTAEWIGTFKRVLGNATPERDLADMEVEDDESAESTAKITYVKLKVNTTIKSQPYGGMKALYRTLQDDAEVEFEVIASANKHIAVVIPCVGVGWAPQVSVREKREFPSRLGGEVKTNRRVTSLTWVGLLSSMLSRDVTYAQHTVFLLEFLSIVGEPLMSLSLPDMNLSTEDVHKILRYCPNLTVVNISNNNDCDLSPIVEAFESGNSRLTSLSIERKNRSSEQSAILQQMTRILSYCGDRESRLTQISMHVLPPRPPPQLCSRFFDDQLMPLISAMNVTRRLDFVQLRGHHMCSVVDTQHRAVPLDFSGTAEGFMRLPGRSKLAFLSVIQGTRNTASCKLDASVVSLIFQFGRSPVARHALLLRPNEFGHV